MKIYETVLISLCFAAFSVAAQETFDRYQIIIDRQPFGNEPLDPNAAQIVPADQSFARNLRLSMLFEGIDGNMRVGIIDNAGKENYILCVGEPKNGIELIEADIHASEAMLQKGNEVVLFKLESDKSKKSSKSKPAKRKYSYAERRRTLLKKIKDRRKKKAKPPTKPKLSGKALKKHLEEVQMDAIRTGKPPLPLPLTPEMDAQLVQEGILPPQ